MGECVVVDDPEVVLGYQPPLLVLVVLRVYPARLPRRLVDRHMIPHLQRQLRLILRLVVVQRLWWTGWFMSGRGR